MNFRSFYIIEIILFCIFAKYYRMISRDFLWLVSWITIYIFLIIFFYDNKFLEILLLLWMIFSAAIVFIINKSQFLISMLSLYRVYIFSFFLIACLGLLQFCLSFFFSIDILITQKWGNGIPRINGFFYEPSFYGTYLFIGWSSLIYIFYKSLNPLIKHQNFYLLVISLAMILSSSRMTIIFMLLSIFYFFLLFSFGKINRTKGFFTLILIIISSFFFYYLYISSSVYIGGLGFEGVGSHSMDERLYQFYLTLDVFKNNFITGVGFYNLPLNIIEISEKFNCLTWKGCQGMSIFLELFAACGIFGSILIGFFIKIFLSKPVKSNENFMIITNSLKFSLFLVLILLSFNQNIFRPYLWILIGFTYSFSHCSYKKNLIK